MSKRKKVGIIVGCVIGIFIIIIIIGALTAPTHTHRLSVSASPSGGGSVSPSGGEYESGVQVVITASPSSGYTFDHWSGASSGTSSTTTITMDSDKTVTANFKSASTVSVDYEVITRYGRGYLSVRVEGPQESYNIILFDPEGERVGYGYISTDDMLTGHETVEVSMTDIGVTNPMPGQYWLIIEESGFLTDKRVFEAKSVFEGPDISITDVEFETNYYEYFGDGDINGAVLEVYNGGDLPVFPDEIRYMVAGEQEDSTVYELLPHGETTVIEDWIYISGLEKGTYSVTVEIYSEGVKLDSYETQVQIG